MNRARTGPTLACLSLALLTPAFACSDLGTHDILVDGNDAVREGLPDAEFVDGWSLEFSSFIVVIHNPGLIERINDEPAWVRQAGVTVWDVAAGDPAEDRVLISRPIRATEYDGFDYRVAPPAVTGYEPTAGNVSDEVVDTMVDEGWSMRVVGTATNGVDTKSFDWSFDSNALYRCEMTGDAAVTLEAEGELDSTIEILGDVLFHTELVDPDPSHAFQAIADADANGDGEVTEDELAAVDIASLADYDTKGKAVDDLWGFVSELSRSVGGVGGFGPCEVIGPEDG